MSAVPDSLSTNPTIFLRLRHADSVPREFAWEEFQRRYAPIIAGYARRIAARPQDVDDVVQDVLLGFFAKSPTFIYDPGKGRFRSYLKVCTHRALLKRLGTNAKFNGIPLDKVDPEAMEVEQTWNDIWEQQQIRTSLDELRQEIGATKTFRAFELYVIMDTPAEEVSNRLDMHINSVYRAKEQIAKLLRERLQKLQNDED
jgi:RNA polymerase sigma factor (sigma-70 family)